MVRKERCSAGAKSRLKLTDRIEVRFEVHDSPPGHLWHIRIWRGTSLGGSHVEMWRGARVASDSGYFAVVRRSKHFRGFGVTVKAIDSATGEVCRVEQLWR